MYRLLSVAFLDDVTDRTEYKEGLDPEINIVGLEWEQIAGDCFNTESGVRM
jgi:hypothetical protein